MHRGLLLRSVVVTLITVVLFFAGAPIATVALVAAAVLMLDHVRPEKVYDEIDWPPLIMFAGLFVIVHAFEVNVVHAWGLEPGLTHHFFRAYAPLFPAFLRVFHGN
ncbi:MAG: SLC13 family permease [Isosphaeraceae bacterium]